MEQGQTYNVPCMKIMFLVHKVLHIFQTPILRYVEIDDLFPVEIPHF